MAGLGDWLKVASAGLSGYSQKPGQKPNAWQGLGQAAGAAGTAIQDRLQRKSADQQAQEAERNTLNSVIGSGPKPPMPPPPTTPAGPYRATPPPPIAGDDNEDDDQFNGRKYYGEV